MTDEQAWRLDELREEARYRRERLGLYRARMYGGRAHSEYRLREHRDQPDYVSVKCRDPDGHIVEAAWEPL